MTATRLHTLRPLAAAIALALSGPAPAATLTVDNVSCDLSSAIIAANTDTATGGCPAGNGADTLNLTAAVYTLSAVDNDDSTYGANGLPVVTSVVTINGDSDQDGRGTVIQRSGAPDTPNFRLLEVFGGTLSLNRVTLNNGVAVERSTSQHMGGGAVLNRQGSLALNDSTVSGNSTDGWAPGGGGIANLDGTLVLNRSQVRDNRSEQYRGGGVYGRYGSITLTDTTVSGNTAHQGGGLFVYVSNATITNSTISGNRAVSSAGGIHIGGREIPGVLTLNNSTVSGNTASNTTSVPGRDLSGGGGLVVSIAGIAHLNHSTVYGNRAGYASGLSLSSPSLVCLNDGHDYPCYYYPDWAIGGIVTLTNSVIANNLVGGDCKRWFAYDAGVPVGVGSLSFSGVNLIGDGSCDAAKLGGLIGDAKLGPLKDNGGPTFTHALLKGSPAINAGPASTCEPRDQRGATRPQGAACDIGAYESVIQRAPVIRPLLTFFDDAAQAGTLVGTRQSPGKYQRRQAVRRQLLLAGDFNRQGSNTDFCRQTSSTLIRIDADGSTPDNNDYVTGPAAPELAAQLTALRTDLGCR